MRAILTALAAAIALFSSALADGCDLKREAMLPMTFDANGHITVPAKVSGHPVTLAVDTGSNHSMLSERAVAALGLKKELYTSSRAWLWGGLRLTSYTNVDEFLVGHTIFTKTQLYVLPDTYFLPGVDGIMGNDVLSKFDADFDFAGAKLNLFNRYHCAGKVVYWTDESQVSVLPFKSTRWNAAPHRESDNQIMFYVELDGKTLFAVLDTGSPNVRLNMEQARNLFDLTPQSADMTPVARPSGTSYRHRFKEMKFGGVTVTDPEVTIDPFDVNQMPGYAPTVLIGMNVIRRLHLYVAYTERKIYVSTAAAH